LPALLAIIFRFFLYDCGLYTLEVKNKPGAAFRDTQRIYGPPPIQWPGALLPNGVPMNGLAQQPPPMPGGGPHYRATFPQVEQLMPVQFSLEDLRNFFIRDGNWYYLLGACSTLVFDCSRWSALVSPRKITPMIPSALAPTPNVITDTNEQ
jgi:PHS family inorganic phosphate transporter-like MFS transporter